MNKLLSNPIFVRPKIITELCACIMLCNPVGMIFLGGMMIGAVIPCIPSDFYVSARSARKEILMKDIALRIKKKIVAWLIFPVLFFGMMILSVLIACVREPAEYIRRYLRYEKLPNSCAMCGECCRNIFTMGIRCWFLRGNRCVIHRWKKYIALCCYYDKRKEKMERFNPKCALSLNRKQ